MQTDNNNSHNKDPHYDDHNSPAFGADWTDEQCTPAAARHQAGLLGLPGITSDSRRVTGRLLKLNYASHHIFFNEKGFHNHLAHMVLAQYSLGAPAHRLEDVYRLEDTQLKPLSGESQQPLTPDNWTQFLGHHNHYTTYLHFFAGQIKALGREETVRRYIFELPGDAGQDFFARFLGGAYHPLIHVGYGLEFGLSPTLAEGLALTAVTMAAVRPLLTGLQLEEAPADSGSAGGSLMKLVAELAEDAALDGLVRFEDNNKFDTTLKCATQTVRRYALRWRLKEEPAALRARAAELLSLAMALHAGPSRPGAPRPKIDFFLMHTLTSAVFLPVLLKHLTPAQGVRLLRGYLSVSLAFYVARGRPQLHLADNLANYESPASRAEDAGSNPWLPVLRRTIAHDDVHVVKAVRSLVYADAYLAHRRRGVEDDAAEDEETRALADDGPGLSEATAHYWLKAALMTLDAVDTTGDWVMDGIGFDEVWKGGH